VTNAKRTFRDNVALFFSQRPNVWIDGMVLESIGGRYAWRSRVSDCRRELGMVIENRLRHQYDASGKRWTTSEYQYVPAATPQPKIVAEPHDLNEWGLRP
jgi:hypothetical protein